MNEPHQVLYAANQMLAGNRVAQAEAYLRAAVAANPESAALHHALGVALIRLQRHGEAIGSFEKSLLLLPSAEAWLNLIQLYFFTGRKSEAVAAGRAAAAAYPADPRVAAELARALDRSGDADGALEVCLEAMRQFGKLPLLVIHAGSLLFMRGKVMEAADLYRACLAQYPADHRIHSALLFTLHFVPGMTQARILAEHVEWDRRHAGPVAQHLPHGNARDPDRKLRIGYVSPDFRSHGIGRFIAPLLEHHTRGAFEVYAYSDVHTPDEFTQRVRAAVHAYRPTFGISDAQLADLIRADRIDILVDLAMHMPGNRLLTFARRPAPVQICYLAYCSTTGLAAMDYRITDPFLDPAPGQYRERPLVIPSYWCYEAPAEAGAIESRPSAKEILFGCLNNFAKVSTGALAAWTEILRQVPESRLLLHVASDNTQQEVVGNFETRGIARSRLEFAGRVSLGDYLKLHARCDIALDPFPYNGGTTSCDALYMGTPVVTLAGGADAPAITRAGASLLSQIGRGELIAGSVQEYVSAAVALAADPARLVELRGALRASMQRSPLMEAPAFSQNLEAAYRRAWQAWCVAAASSR
jgi:predicted O-linked N-acetylglucosamine transferase (SPINDLY family)